MYLFFSRALWALSGLAVCAGTLQAQTLPTMRQAVDAAWALSPQARALTNRQLELDARGRVASSFISGQPSVSLAQSSDRMNSNGGFREHGIEIAAPLWRSGVRAATAGQVEADRHNLERQQLLARARLAGEVRELAAHAAIAQIELQLAVRRLAEAKLLTGDIERRVKAGDAARVDLLQSQSSTQLAAGVQTQADSALKRAQAQWLALTGLSEVSVLDESVGVARDHPAVTAADAQLRAAQARLELTQKDRSDPMEVSLGVIRERAALGSASETRMQVAVHIPFGGDSRNAPRVAAANADVDAAQADALAAVRTVQAERSAATSDLAAARLAETLAAGRARLSTEAQGLLANAYRLGESDLPTRLRADNERCDAELSHARARVETRRAIAKLNQAFGVQP